MGKLVEWGASLLNVNTRIRKTGICECPECSANRQACMDAHENDNNNGRNGSF